MSDEQRTIISRRVSQSDQAVEGSLKIPCAECGAILWVSPSSFLPLAEGARVICMQCTPPDAYDSGVEAAPGALDEVELRDGPDGRKRAEKALQHFNELARRRRG